MRYVVPLNAPEEVAELVAAGADELYCGFQDEWWVARYGDHDSASRRQGRANLATADELARAAASSRAHGVELHLALNARYTEPQLDRLEQVCDAFWEMGGAGVIASDLGLLWRLRDRAGFSRRLSILAVAQNVPTLEAYRSLGVTRAVLPRFVEPGEASALVSGSPGIEAEVMAFFDKCPWVDGYCRHRHGVSYPARARTGETDAARPLYTFDTTYTAHACMGGGRSYPRPFPCAACDLPRFEDAGVGFAKLGGRGRPLEERLRALRFLREAAGLAGDDGRRALYRSTFGCACSCYYGDAAQDRDAIEEVPQTSPTYPIDGLVGVPCSDPRPGSAATSQRSGPRFKIKGSQTDRHAFWVAHDAQCSSAPAASSAPVELLVPPLSQKDLTRFRESLGRLAGGLPPSSRLVVNDLGTLLTVCRAIRAGGLGVGISMGTLLARLDDPAEVAHFLDAGGNPPVGVWGPDGEPRVLTYRQPPAELVRHWGHPSNLEPSAREAIAWLATRA